jgi:sugar O-acyltransferase (sialic acid O-acetyltransferase NeuD family)
MKLFFWGGGATAKLMKPVVEHHGHTVEVVYDKNSAADPGFHCTLIHGDVKIPEYARRCEGFLATIAWDSGTERFNCSRILEEEGLVPVSAIHPQAYIADSARQGKGLQTMVGATVTADVRLGDYVTLNTNCTVDHDCIIGDGVHIMGGAVLASSVVVGDFATIGSNATILPGRTIGKGAFVGAGAVVTKDVEENAVVVGAPARFVRYRE